MLMIGRVCGARGDVIWRSLAAALSWVLYTDSWLGPCMADQHLTRLSHAHAVVYSYVVFDNY